jgi:hypothetical protein
VRDIRLECPPSDDGLGVFSVTSGRRVSFYTFQEIPCTIGGRGFAIHKLGLGTLYHVRLDEGPESSCECLGFLRHGMCRHILGLRALDQSGLLTREQPSARAVISSEE